MKLINSVWFRILVSTLVLVWLASYIDMAEAVDSVAAISRIHLAAALGLVVADRCLTVCRWVILVRRSEPAISVKSAVWVFLVGTYIGQMLPGVGGDAARAYVLAGRTEQRVDAVALVLIDRCLGVCSLTLLAAIGLFVWSDRAAVELQLLSAVLAIVAMLGVGALLWADRVVSSVVPVVWRQRAGMGWLERLGAVIGRYRRHALLMSGLLVLSTAVQVTRVLQAYALGRGLDIDVPLSYYFAFMPVGILVILLPISIGGFGTAQGVIVWLLRPVGVPDAQAFALSTLFVLTGLLGAMPGAFLYLRSRITEAQG